jgi:hypothetical protein
MNGSAMSGQAIEKAELLQLRSLLDAQTRLRDLAEGSYADTLAVLWRIAQAALPEEMDARRREDPGFEGVSPKALGDWIVAQLTAKHHRLRLLGRDDLSQQLETAQSNVKSLSEEVRALQEDRLQLQRQLSSLRTVEAQLATRDAQVADLQIRLDRLQQEAVMRRKEVRSTSPGRMDPLLLPDPSKHWFAEWQGGPHFELDSALVRLLGENGYTMPETLMLALFQAGLLLSSDASSGTAQRLLERLKDAELIEDQEVRLRKRGALGLVRLTEKGKEAYSALYAGQSAARPDWDRLMERYESAEQAALVLQAHSILLSRGASHLEFGAPGRVASDEITGVADLTCRLDGRPLQALCRIEAEDHMRAPWAALSPQIGELCFFVPDTKAQSAVISAVTRWSMERGIAVELRVCNQGAATPDGPMWTYERTLSW